MPLVKEDEGNGGSSLAIVVFVTGDERFDAADVLDAAWFRGELQPLWREFLIGLACEQEARGLAPADDILQSLSEEIRYKHELITSEETEAWLTAHRLSLDDLTDYCHRRYWREHGTNPAPAPDIDYLNATSDQRELFLKDLFFAGPVDGLARQLAWRVAASVAADSTSPALADGREAQRAHFYQRTVLASKKLSESLRQIGRNGAWLETLIGREACYVWHCTQICTTENRTRSLATLRLPLTRFEVELIDLESEDAAREACFCIETDGLSMAELAGQEHYRIERREYLLEEFAEELQLRFLGAGKGHVLQITTPDRRFQVCRILDKREPTLADENVVRRVDGELITAHFENLVSKNIVWLIKSATPS